MTCLGTILSLPCFLDKSPTEKSLNLSKNERVEIRLVVTCYLQDLATKVVQHSGEEDWGTGANPGGVRALPQLPVDPGNQIHHVAIIAIHTLPYGYHYHSISLGTALDSKYNNYNY